MGWRLPLLLSASSRNSALSFDAKGIPTALGTAALGPRSGALVPLREHIAHAGNQWHPHTGGIEPLVALARDGTAKQKENAASALCSLALNAHNRAAIAEAGDDCTAVHSSLHRNAFLHVHALRGASHHSCIPPHPS